MVGPPIQFQKSISLNDFLSLYGTEDQCFKEWKNNEQNRLRLADTIRNPEGLDWMKLRFSESLPVSS